MEAAVKAVTPDTIDGSVGEPKASPHADMANAIRFLAADAVQQANSGHPGMPMGMADVATVLFSRFLKFDPSAPDWADRDRFVLSAGHGSMLLYALLYLTGYEGVTIDQLRNFRQLGSTTAGHPEYGHMPGIETTTGPLGQGIATAVGMAMAERMMAARYGDAVVDHHTYVIAGDGCLMEGISQEAISMAGHMGLGKLVVLFDDNSISIDGPTSLSTSDNQQMRFEASGWHVQAIDGHDPHAIAVALRAARAETAKPSLICCRTTIGFGAPTKAGTAATHGAPLGAEELAGAREAMGWNHDPFVIPPDCLAAWREVGAQGAQARGAWRARLDQLPADQQAEFERRMNKQLPADWSQAVIEHKRAMSAEAPSMATRVASQKALDALAAAVPELLGGSADLTGSNNTKAKGQEAISPTDFSGSYVHYGVREHGMAAAMNGIALHGGFIPYGGTFLVFTDYCRPSMRLSALMNQRVVYVMTHDSIGLGEDGPTHQPVEHLASLRVMPNMNVFRPCDAVETAECWELALENATTPSTIALSRQNLPTLRTEHTDENLCRRGAYVLADSKGERRVTLVATGSEVAIAMDARDLLQAAGLPTAVVSMPCCELFDEQPDAYRDMVLPPSAVTVAVEAAASRGWERYVGPKGGIVGMTGFGASAPAPQLYEHFGITAEKAAELAKALTADAG